MTDSKEVRAQVVKASVKFTEEEGSELKFLIQEKIPANLNWYARKVGLSSPNLYAVLAGNRTCTLEFLNKMVSGINYEAVLLGSEILIRECKTGGTVLDVDSILQEEELLLEEKEDLEGPESFL